MKSALARCLLASSSYLMASVVPAFAETPAEIDAKIAATKIGDVVSFTTGGCSAYSDKDDVNSTFGYTAPSGFQILKAEVRVRHKKHEANWFNLKTTQAEEVNFAQFSNIDYKVMLDDLASASNDTVRTAQIKALAGVVQAVKTINAQTHSKLGYGCHAEGHKYSSDDGEIATVTEITLLRRPTDNDFAAALLELVSNVATTDEEKFQKALELMQTILMPNNQ